MLIPKCCKNCANKAQIKFGTGCICDAPGRCGELVEDDEDIKRYEEMAKSAPQLGNWVQCPDCEDFKKQIKEKDHRIAVLERALELAVKDKLFFEKQLLVLTIGVKIGKYDDSIELKCPKTEIYYKEQAEKELEEKDD